MSVGGNAVFSRTNRNQFGMIKYIWKIVLCTLSLMVGTMAGGMLSTALQLEQPKIPAVVDLRLLGIYTFAAGVVLSIALAELSRQLRGNRWVHFAATAWFAFAWLGINNTIEASIFTTIGGWPSMVVTMQFPCLFVAGAIALLFGGRESEASFFDGLRQLFANRTTAQWTIRLSAALLAFPIVYFTFGMPVGLIVGDYYRNHAFGLQFPALNVVMGMQLIRGTFALLATLPILITWPWSRRRFVWIFGLSLFVVSGLYGLIQAYWIPWTLRSVHIVEFLLDSLAYAWLLAVLLLSRAPAHNHAPV